MTMSLVPELGATSNNDNEKKHRGRSMRAHDNVLNTEARHHVTHQKQKQNRWANTIYLDKNVCEIRCPCWLRVPRKKLLHHRVLHNPSRWLSYHSGPDSSGLGLRVTDGALTTSALSAFGRNCTLVGVRSTAVAVNARCLTRRSRRRRSERFSCQVLAFARRKMPL